MERWKENEARLGGAQRKDKRKWAQIEIQEIAFKCKKTTKLNREFAESPSLDIIKIN